MTLESSLPWLSAIAAVAAGVSMGRPASRATGGLKAVAFAALAVFAYFRWIAPAAVSLALLLEAVAAGVLPTGPPRWRRPLAILPIAGWLVLADLFWTSGDGRLVFLTDAVKAGLLVALLAAVGFGLRRIWVRTSGPRVGVGVGVGAAALALVLMAAMALTLDWGLWPALAGAACVVVSQALPLVPEEAQNALRKRATWALEYLGYGAIAYAFLR